MTRVKSCTYFFENIGLIFERFLFLSRTVLNLRTMKRVQSYTCCFFFWEYRTDIWEVSVSIQNSTEPKDHEKSSIIYMLFFFFENIGLIFERSPFLSRTVLNLRTMKRVQSYTCFFFKNTGLIFERSPFLSRTVLNLRTMKRVQSCTCFFLRIQDWYLRGHCFYPEQYWT